VEQVWLIAALWMGLALLAVFCAHLLRLPTPVCEIAIGAVAPLAIGPWLGWNLLSPSIPWIVFLAGTGSMLLTFLAGTELDPTVLRATWREALLVGFVGCAVPLLGVAGVAHFLLGWTMQSAWVAAVALSTGSVSVVYTVMTEMGLSHTGLGQGLLATSYVNNLCSAIALALILTPFTVRSAILLGACVVAGLLVPAISRHVLGRLRSRAAQPDIRYLLFLLFGLGGLSVWAGSELVLPAYVMGMALSGLVGRNHALIHHLRVMTFSILTPFYFLRAGTQVHIPALAAVPWLFVALLAAKLVSKLVGVLPALQVFHYSRREGIYGGLMLSLGLMLGTVIATSGLNRGLVDTTQYSHIVAAVVASAVIPVTIANTFFAPKHLLPGSAEGGRRRTRREREVKKAGAI
jgi:glutathione-regulated potassium-efflux system ancillary protein KefC